MLDGDSGVWIMLGGKARGLSLSPLDAITPSRDDRGYLVDNAHRGLIGPRPPASSSFVRQHGKGAAPVAAHAMVLAKAQMVLIQWETTRREGRHQAKEWLELFCGMRKLHTRCPKVGLASFAQNWPEGEWCLQSRRRRRRSRWR